MAPPPANIEASRADKLAAIEALGLDPWGHRFDGHTPIGDILRMDADRPEAERPRVKAAGRIVLRRDSGKVHWVDLWDWSTPLRPNAETGEMERGKIQVMVGQKQVGDDWKLAQNLDLGDLLGVEGTFGRTRTGEPTIFAEKLTILGKSMLPHPDKHAGMSDIEFRLRHRYLDLVYNPETLDRAKKRVLIVRAIRRHLDDQGYLEVETPTLHSIAGGAAARPFVTHHNALDIQLYQRIALELHLKRLLVGGIEKVYEIGRVFRNEGISPRHNPEFTMMELYQAYGDYRSMMDLTEALVLACIDAIGGGYKRPFAGHEIDFSPPWKRAKYGDLFAEHVGVAMDDAEGVRRAAEGMGYPTAGRHPDVVIQHLFEECVEEKLEGPVFVHDYPASLCPLTKRQRGNPAIAERFELYVRGMELANAYTELNDPATQEQTFRQQLAGLKEEDSMAKMDDDFVRALRHGMPPAGGLGIGIDRLAMLLTDTQTIRDVILFPLLRPER
ncbi:MAG: lysine--tRNA ligase [Gemmataceae bacterium]|nr:lysine--tRNA ligase [Gemmataceae bacterium]